MASKQGDGHHTNGTTWLQMGTSERDCTRARHARRLIIESDSTAPVHYEQQDLADTCYEAAQGVRQA